MVTGEFGYLQSNVGSYLSLAFPGPFLAFREMSDKLGFCSNGRNVEMCPLNELAVEYRRFEEGTMENQQWWS